MYQVLGRLARLAQDRKPTELLSFALREASALVGADLLLLRVPSEPSGSLEIRWPPAAAWPHDRQVSRWRGLVVRSARPVHIGRGHPGAGMVRRYGVVLPVFTATGAIGVLVAASRRGPRFTPAQCCTLSLFVQIALASVESSSVRAHNEAQAAAEVHERLAREIHDGPLQMLSGVLLHVRNAAHDADPRSRAALVKLDGEVRRAVARMRSLIRRLRVAQAEIPLEARIRRALMRLQRACGVSWALQWREPAGLLTLQAANEVFQVINEALVNVYRHSKATQVSVVGRSRGETFEVAIRDDGVGFDVAKAIRRDLSGRSFGLVGMQERVAAIGGTLTVRSQAGRGTRVTISLPLSASAAGKSA
jgi:signal transduction histidine kinase